MTEQEEKALDFILEERNSKEQLQHPETKKISDLSLKEKEKFLIEVGARKPTRDRNFRTTYVTERKAGSKRETKWSPTKLGYTEQEAEAILSKIESGGFNTSKQ